MTTSNLPGAREALERDDNAMAPATNGPFEVNESYPPGQWIIHSKTEYGPGEHQRRTVAYFIRKADAEAFVEARNAALSPTQGDNVDPGAQNERVAELERELAELEGCERQGVRKHMSGLRQERIAVVRAELSRLRNEQPKGGDVALKEHPSSLTSGPGSECDRSGAAPSPARSPEPQDVRATLKELRDCLFDILHDGLKAHSERADSVIVRADTALAQQAPDAVQPVGLEVEETAAYALSEAKAETNELISLIRQGVWSSVKDEMIPLTIEDDSDPSVGMVGARYLALPEGYDIWPTDTAPPRPDAVREALLEDGIRNLCYTAFQRRASGRNSDDGGECDWMNDTLPIIERGIKNLLACTPAPSANEIERLTKERDEARLAHGAAKAAYELACKSIDGWINNYTAAESALAKANARIAELEASERPAPSASAGLLEAAELAEREASSYEATANNSFVQDEKDQYRGKARVLERFAEKLRTRAADSSAPSADGSGAGEIRT